MGSWIIRVALTVLVGVALPATLRAQHAPEALDSMDEILMERDLARDRFELSQASIKNLARRRLEAGRAAHQARYQEFLAGRGTLDILLEAQAQLAQARQPPSTPRAVNRRALEEKWRLAWEAYQLTRAGHDAGRVKTADYYQALFNRLDTEIQLALTRPKK